MLYIKEALPTESEFVVNFQKAMASETEGLILEDEKVKKGVAKFFDQPSLGTYFIAYDHKKPVGCLLIQYEWSDWRNAYVIWLHSVYVIPLYRGKGVFKMLYDKVLEIVKQDENYAGIRLFVDKSNIKAQKVYKKMGMTSEHYELFEWMK